MTPADLARHIDDYCTGLQVEIALLRRIEAAAALQRHASTQEDFEAMAAATDERDHLMVSLVTLEGQLRAVRETLAAHRVQARTVPGYAHAVTLHGDAAALIDRVLRNDQESLRALAAAEAARRELVRALEQGETTLSAYRRTTPVHSATLVDRRG